MFDLLEPDLPKERVVELQAMLPTVPFGMHQEMD
jgi:hypothetical protein